MKSPTSSATSFVFKKIFLKSVYSMEKDDNMYSCGKGKKYNNMFGHGNSYGGVKSDQIGMYPAGITAPSPNYDGSDLFSPIMSQYRPQYQTNIQDTNNPPGNSQKPTNNIFAEKLQATMMHGTFQNTLIEKIQKNMMQYALRNASNELNPNKQEYAIIVDKDIIDTSQCTQYTGASSNEDVSSSHAQTDTANPRKIGIGKVFNNYLSNGQLAYHYQFGSQFNKIQSEENLNGKYEDKDNDREYEEEVNYKSEEDKKTEIIKGCCSDILQVIADTDRFKEKIIDYLYNDKENNISQLYRLFQGQDCSTKELLSFLSGYAVVFSHRCYKSSSRTVELNSNSNGDSSLIMEEKEEYNIEERANLEFIDNYKIISDIASKIDNKKRECIANNPNISKKDFSEHVKDIINDSCNTNILEYIRGNLSHNNNSNTNLAKLYQMSVRINLDEINKPKSWFDYFCFWKKEDSAQNEIGEILKQKLNEHALDVEESVRLTACSMIIRHMENGISNKGMVLLALKLLATERNSIDQKDLYEYAVECWKLIGQGDDFQINYLSKNYNELVQEQDKKINAISKNLIAVLSEQANRRQKSSEITEHYTKLFAILGDSKYDALGKEVKEEQEKLENAMKFTEYENHYINIFGITLIFAFVLKSLGLNIEDKIKEKASDVYSETLKKGQELLSNYSSVAATLLEPALKFATTAIVAGTAFFYAKKSFDTKRTQADAKNTFSELYKKLEEKTKIIDEQIRIFEKMNDNLIKLKGEVSKEKNLLADRDDLSRRFQQLFDSFNEKAELVEIFAHKGQEDTIISKIRNLIKEHQEQSKISEKECEKKYDEIEQDNKCLELTLGNYSQLLKDTVEKLSDLKTETEELKVSVALNLQYIKDNGIGKANYSTPINAVIAVTATAAHLYLHLDYYTKSSYLYGIATPTTLITLASYFIVMQCVTKAMKDLKVVDMSLALVSLGAVTGAMYSAEYITNRYFMEKAPLSSLPRIRCLIGLCSIIAISSVLINCATLIQYFDNIPAMTKRKEKIEESIKKQRDIDIKKIEKWKNQEIEKKIIQMTNQPINNNKEEEEIKKMDDEYKKNVANIDQELQEKNNKIRTKIEEEIVRGTQGLEKERDQKVSELQKERDQKVSELEKEDKNDKQIKEIDRKIDSINEEISKKISKLYENYIADVQHLTSEINKLMEDEITKNNSDFGKKKEAIKGNNEILIEAKKELLQTERKNYILKQYKAGENKELDEAINNIKKEADEKIEKRQEKTWKKIKKIDKNANIIPLSHLLTLTYSELAEIAVLSAVSVTILHMIVTKILLQQSIKLTPGFMEDLPETISKKPEIRSIYKYYSAIQDDTGKNTYSMYGYESNMTLDQGLKMDDISKYLPNKDTLAFNETQIYTNTIKYAIFFGVPLVILAFYLVSKATTETKSTFTICVGSKISIKELEGQYNKCKVLEENAAKVKKPGNPSEVLSVSKLIEIMNKDYCDHINHIKKDRKGVSFLSSIVGKIRNCIGK